MASKIYKWFQCLSGATAIEYGLIAAGISLAICAAIYAFGDDLGNVFVALGEPRDNIIASVETGR